MDAGNTVYEKDVLDALPDGVVTVSVSCLTGNGIDQLKSAAESQFVNREIDYSGEAVIANARQFSAL